MKLIIAGSRELREDSFPIIREKTDAFLWSLFEKNQKEGRTFDGITIISGTARGADRLGERYGEENHYQIKRMPADWDKHGKSAGYKRNAEMAEQADALIVFWDGKSRGSKHMIDIWERSHSSKPHRVVFIQPSGLPVLRKPRG